MRSSGDHALEVAVVVEVVVTALAGLNDLARLSGVTPFAPEDLLAAWR